MTIHKRFLRKLLGKKQDVTRDWVALLQGNASIGANSDLAGAILTTRDPAGCSLAIGDGSTIQCSIVFEKSEVDIRIGSNTFIGGGSTLDAAQSIVIADDVLIAHWVTIMDHDAHSLHFEERKNDVRDWMEGKKDWTVVRTAPVVIESKAWVGTRALILKGVTIGEGAIVGAGSVVTKSVPPWTIVAGNPARIIRENNHDKR